MSVTARHLTARNPDLDSDGAAIGVMARALGTPLMPWQQQVADVATEHHPTQPGAWRYPIVVLTIPRQSGKTTLLRALMAQRALMTDGLQAFYTAQTGKDARVRWRELVSAVDNGPLADVVTVRRSQGSEALTFATSGGTVAPFAPTPKSLHGYTPNLVCIDEAFSFDATQGADLMGAVVPAQQTLIDRQLWIVSTAGDARSQWLREWVDRGREAVRDPAASVCYADWGCPDDADPFDPTLWETWHPAVGHTTTPQALADAASSLPRGEFVRAYGNQWTQATETVIDADDLAACIAEQTPADPADTALGYEVAPDRSAAAVWAAWTGPDGRTCLRPYLARPGTAWLVDALAAAERAGHTLWADDGGTTRALTDQARQAGVTVTTLTTRDLAAATGNLIQAVHEHRITRPGGDGLDQDAAAATTRLLSGAPVWDRTGSTQPIHHLIAATVAMWGTAHKSGFWTLP